MGFSSAEIEMMENFKIAFGLKNKITPCGRGGEIEKNYFQIHFGDKVLYQYLNSIGLTQRKSKTIKAVTIPHEYFVDFVRGVFDGDGSFYTSWDRRWAKSFRYEISFASASLDFITWLRKEIAIALNTKGLIHKGDGVYEIRYTKSDTRILFSAMYKSKNILFLRRKYNKMKTAFLFDQGLHPERDSIVMPQ